MNPKFKRFFIFSSLIIASFTLIWLAYAYKKSANSIVYNAPESTQKALVVLSNSVSDLDTDGDGLKDWEESIWGTDRNNPDTDGDGTLDGMEITLNRNPLIKGPNDSLDKFPINSIQNPEDNTQSSILSRELFAQYAKAKSETGTLTEQDQQEIIENIIKNAESAIERPKEYSYNSLIVLNNINQESLQRYADNISAIFNKNRPKNVGDELSLMAYALENRTNSISQNMQSIGKFYEDTANQLLNVPVPSVIANNHLSIINMYLRIAKNVLAFDYALRDSFIASVNLSDYVKNTEQLSKDLTEIRNYLERNQISL